ncbi:hypothetical protein [Microbacterium sp. ZW T5_56]|uniref:hypothetical protein n=1 Tax=Microbacterium sp. ZW T5_56 TaxID=3378081 RepID=UPI003852C537
MKRTWVVMRHATPMMLAQLIPLASSFVIVSLALMLGRDDFVTVTGISATIVGLGALINVGVGIATLRDLARTGDDPRGVAQALSWNLRVASAISFVSLAVSLVTAVVLWLVLPEGSVARMGVVLAFLLQIPIYLISPHTSVLSSAFQHLDRERENFGITLSRSVVALGVGIVVVLLVDDDVIAIGLQAAVGSVMVGLMLAERRRRLARSEVRFRVFPRPVFSGRAVWDRTVNSLDGAVFMLLFIVAQLIAASISLEVGAQVSAAVAFCRTVIIPLKMIGVTAGRMSLREPGLRSAFALSSISATAMIVVPLALLLATLAFVGYSPLSGTVLTLLVAAQLLVEPCAGPLFSYLRVSFGARPGLAGLIITYVIVAPIVLMLCKFTLPTAVGIWICLLGARLLFAALTLLALRQGLRRALSGASTRVGGETT